MFEFFNEENRRFLGFQNTEQVREAPFMIKFISVLNYVSSGFLFMFAIFSLLLGFALLVFRDSFLSLFENASFSSVSGEITFVGILLIISFFVLATFGIFLIFLGVSLWKGKRWARVVELVLLFVLFIFSIYCYYLSSVANLIFFLPIIILFALFIFAVILYLFFSKKVKENLI